MIKNELIVNLIADRPVRLAYQPPASSTFLSEQISHQQPPSSTFLSAQTSISHQPPAKRTGWLWLIRETSLLSLKIQLILN
jgi:hypothetical protein